jgi:hypothetical protein
MTPRLAAAMLGMALVATGWSPWSWLRAPAEVSIPHGPFQFQELLNKLWSNINFERFHIHSFIYDKL